jgi:hypothetical protein
MQLAFAHWCGVTPASIRSLTDLAAGPCQTPMSPSSVRRLPIGACKQHIPTLPSAWTTAAASTSVAQGAGQCEIGAPANV